MRKFGWLLLIPVALLVWWGLGAGGASVKVHFSIVKPTAIESTVPTNGKVEPAQWAAARAEIAGVVKSIQVQRGQDVSAGQLLVSLDTTAARADLAAAIARQQEAQAGLFTLGQGGKASAVATLNDTIEASRAAVETAQRIYDSDQKLLQQQAATRLQVQTDADTLARAKLNLLAAQNQKKASVTATDKTVAEARLHDAQAAVTLAQHRIALAEIRSPVAGTVYQFDLKVGAYLEPGKLVAQIGNLNQVKVVVYVDEPDLGRVGLGMPVQITWEGHPGLKWTGKVDRMPTEVVALGTRTVGEVSTVIENPQHDLLPGVSVDATIVSKVVKDALGIPKAALRRLANQDGVYKLTDDRLQWTPVTTGISDVNNIQVLSGLRGGDRVADGVVDPKDAEIRSGMRVKPVFN